MNLPGAVLRVLLACLPAPVSAGQGTAEAVRHCLGAPQRVAPAGQTTVWIYAAGIHAVHDRNCQFRVFLRDGRVESIAYSGEDGALGPGSRCHDTLAHCLPGVEIEPMCGTGQRPMAAGPLAWECMPKR